MDSQVQPAGGPARIMAHPHFGYMCDLCGERFATWESTAGHVEECTREWIAGNGPVRTVTR